MPRSAPSAHRALATAVALLLAPLIASAQSTPVGEAGKVSTTNNVDEWNPVVFSRTYTDPIVVCGPPTRNGGDPCNIRVRNVTPTGFEFRIDEWDYLDGNHSAEETVSWAVIERGLHQFSDGTTIEAGSIASVGEPWASASLTGAFLTNPAVVTQCVTVNDPVPVCTRMRNVVGSGFQVRLQEEEDYDYDITDDPDPNIRSHGTETVHWIAMAGNGTPQTGAPYEAGVTPAALTDSWYSISFQETYIQSPALLASMQTYNGPHTAAIRMQGLSGGGVQLMAEEEKSHDDETTHNNAEEVGYLCFVPGDIVEYEPEPEPPLHPILQGAGVTGGFVVHLDCNGGSITAELGANSRFSVHGLDTDPADVTAARTHIKGLGRYGRISVDRLSGTTLPYVDGSVTLVVCDGPLPVPMAEVSRVLAPLGVAYLKPAADWEKTVKPRPPDIDEWTHYLYDATGNAVSQDTVIAPPRRYQWLGSPKWSRHHDRMSSFNGCVTAGGRLFHVMDEGSRRSILLPPKWKLIGRDAFNGTILWKRPIGSWHPQTWTLKSGPVQLTRRLVASGDEVYATLSYDGPVCAIDAATGEILRVYTGTSGAEEIIHSNGDLFVLVNTAPPTWSLKPGNSKRDDWIWDDTPRKVLAIEAATGTQLWEYAPANLHVAPMTLAADDSAVFFHDATSIIKLDRIDGSTLATSPPIAIQNPLRSNFGPSLIIYDDTVSFIGAYAADPSADASGYGSKPWQVSSLDASDLSILWQKDDSKSAYKSPHDLYVIDDLVWVNNSALANPVFRGYDRHTGALIRTVDPQLNINWHHHRCHRNKATVNWFINSRTTTEFINTQTAEGFYHFWVRGACLHGSVPANGFLYHTPHNCACYQQSKLIGLGALSPAHSDPNWPTPDPDAARLETGPAHGQPVGSSPAVDDWPTYRQNNMRNGSMASQQPAQLEKLWESQIGDKLSSVTVAEGKLFVSDIDKHTLWALHAELGTPAWSYTTGARIDSPPTIHQGRVIFGSNDGHVYCLRASDGALIWRFQAAPLDVRMMAFEQLESLWPVHGSVTVVDGRVYCIAGRSAFVDGGMRLLQLDPATGAKLDEEIINHLDPNTGEDLQDHVKQLQFPTGSNDILSYDGTNIYLKSQPFNLDGSRPPGSIAPHAGGSKVQGAAQYQTGPGRHFFCPTGFLDDTWYHRTYLLWGKSWSSGWDGYYEAGQHTPGGRILVTDGTNIYGFGRKPQYYKWTTPLEHQLWSIPIDFTTDPADEADQIEDADYNWHRDVGLLVRAMALTGNHLFIAGPPDLVDEENAWSNYTSGSTQTDLARQDAAMHGAEGGLLWAIDATTGATLEEYTLDSLPSWDAMAVANGSVYFSTTEGKVVCYRAAGLIEVGMIDRR